MLCQVLSGIRTSLGNQLVFIPMLGVHSHFSYVHVFFINKFFINKFQYIYIFKFNKSKHILLLSNFLIFYFITNCAILCTGKIGSFPIHLPLCAAAIFCHLLLRPSVSIPFTSGLSYDLCESPKSVRSIPMSWYLFCLYIGPVRI